MRVFHYTIGKYLPAIISSGVIRLSTANLQAGERAAVYFSTNPVWEQTANKGTVDYRGRSSWLTKEQTHAMGNGLTRIQVQPEAAPYTWPQFKRLTSIPWKLAASLEDAARAKGASSSEWRISLEPVAADKWICVETWDGKQWNPVPF